MTKRELKNIIKNLLMEEMGVDNLTPAMGSEKSEQNSNEVTFTVKGPSGEGSFTLSKEVATSLMKSLMDAVGEGESEPTSPNTPETPETPEEPEEPEQPSGKLTENRKHRLKRTW